MKNWDDLRIFIAVARTRSVRGAAAALSVNQSTVSRRIAGFERSLGVRLFDRVPTGYELTTAGEAMLTSAVRIAEQISGLERHVLGQDARLGASLGSRCHHPWA